MDADLPSPFFCFKQRVCGPNTFSSRRGMQECRPAAGLHGGDPAVGAVGPGGNGYVVGAPQARGYGLACEGDRTRAEAVDIVAAVDAGAGVPHAALFPFFSPFVSELFIPPARPDFSDFAPFYDSKSHEIRRDWSGPLGYGEGRLKIGGIFQDLAGFFYLPIGILGGEGFRSS